MAKLMVSIHNENYRILSLEAENRGITIQELLRAVIVPDWIRGSAQEIRGEIAPRRPTGVSRTEEIPPIIGRQWPQRGLAGK